MPCNIFFLKGFIMWILFAFGSAFFAGLTAVLAKIGLRNTDSDLTTALRTVVVLLFAWLMVFVVGSQKTIMNISTHSLIFLVLSGIATGASWLCYFKALQLGDVNKVTPVDKSSTVLTMLLAFVLLQEPLGHNMVLGMILIALGTWMMIQKKAGLATGKGGHAWLWYALLSAVFAALTAVLAKIGITDVESTLGTAIRTIVVLIMAWFLVAIKGKQRLYRQISLKSKIFIVLSGFATGLSWLCYFHALQNGPASIVVPIDKLSIVFTVVLAWLLFREKLTRKSFIGLMLIVAGTLVLLVKF